MAQLKVTLIRSPSLHEYGPEEDKVLGTYTSVQLTYDLLRVFPADDSNDTHVGVYDDEIGGWRIFGANQTISVWSDILIQGAEE